MSNLSELFITDENNNNKLRKDNNTTANNNNKSLNDDNIIAPQNNIRQALLNNNLHDKETNKTKDKNGENCVVFESENKSKIREKMTEISYEGNNDYKNNEDEKQLVQEPPPNDYDNLEEFEL